MIQESSFTPWNVDLPKPNMIHDCCITKNKVIFLDLSLVFNPKLMANGSLPFGFDAENPVRFGIMDKMETDPSNITWIEAPPQMIFHTLNAWEEEEDGIITMYACKMDFFELSLESLKETLPDRERQVLTRYTFDLNTRKVKMETVHDAKPMPLDFPVHSPNMVGRKTKYGYMAAFTPGQPLCAAEYHKVNLEKGSLEGIIKLGEGRHGGEAIFVPTTTDGANEDDGYLLAMVLDTIRERSELCIWSATSMSDSPVATVVLSERVPLGFHALFIPQSRL